MVMKRLKTWLKDAAGPSGNGPAAGSIDKVTSLRISGWAWSPDDRQRQHFHLLVNDTLRLPLGAPEPRPDVMGAGFADRPDTGFTVYYDALPAGTLDALRALMKDGSAEFTLMAHDAPVTRMRASVDAEFAVSMHSSGAGQLDGLVSAPAPPEPVSVEILADGWLIGRQPLVMADPERAAGEGAGWGCRFDLRLPCSVSGAKASTVRARLTRRIGQPEAALELAAPQRADSAANLAGAMVALDERPPVTIIILPGSDSDIRACQEAVRLHTSLPARLVLLAGKPDGADVTVLAPERKDATLGEELNRAAGLHPQNDIVVLGAQARPGPRWLENLQLAAHTGPDTGLASTLAAPFDLPPDWTMTDMARLAMQGSGLLWPETRQISTPCVYVRRDCLDSAGPFSGDQPLDTLEARARTMGWYHVVDDRTVIAPGQPSEALRPAERLARARFGHALGAARASQARPRPRILFVISVSEGGTASTNADLMAGLQDRYDTLLLQCDSRDLTLKRITAQGEEELDRHRLAERIDPVSHRSSEYDRIVAEWLTAYGVELVHIRHLAWHGLGLPGTARRLAIPVIHSFHDYYAACPTVKLVDGDGRYCAGRCTPQGTRDCAPDLWVGTQTPPLKNAWLHDWRANFSQALGECDAFVTTSPAARALILDVFPALASRRFEVIVHGRDLPAPAHRAPPELAPGTPLRILLAGHVTQAKGAALIREVKALDQAGELEFHILGTCDFPLEPDDAVIHGAYQREDFQTHVRSINPHIGAALSIWPETYLHTLSEMWAAGLPVLALRLGAMAERVGGEGPGWLADPEPDGLGARLHAQFTEIAREQAWTRPDKQPSLFRPAGHAATVAAMASQYAALYRSVLEARRAFAGKPG